MKYKKTISLIILIFYSLISSFILECVNCANPYKKVQQPLSIYDNGKNGHIAYDVGLNVIDTLEVAEYLRRVC